MKSYYKFLNELVNSNKKEYSSYSSIKWINQYTADEAQQKRDELTKELDDNWLFKQTKPYHHQLSKGCKLCGLGLWSCLFITGKCNAKCFYCPASQEIDHQPTTQQLNFDSPEAYSEYINYFKFKGVSFSGGEPLLVFDRVMQYLKSLRKKCTPELYIWMYTNGILGDENNFKKLASAGLNEVRFDIGATGFTLDKIKYARGIVDNITIEIPAIPEEKEKLKALLPEMVKMGVTNLNLHQLRLTNYNAPRIIKKDYTFIPAEQPIVLESELTALEIINYAKKLNIDIGINYCSFFFKNRFQKAGFRKQITNTLSNPEELITEKGFIRELNDNFIRYKGILISDYENKNGSINSKELTLNHKSYTIKKELALPEIKIDDTNREEIKDLLKKEPETIPDKQYLYDIWHMEYIEKGLRNY